MAPHSSAFSGRLWGLPPSTFRHSLIRLCVDFSPHLHAAPLEPASCSCEWCWGRIWCLPESSLCRAGVGRRWSWTPFFLEFLGYFFSRDSVRRSQGYLWEFSRSCMALRIQTTGGSRYRWAGWAVR